MQLKGPALRHALALASCALVHGSSEAAEGDWKLAGQVLSYAEKDRVSVFATALNATRDLGDESSVTVRGVYDSLSGASPNGAAPSNTAQTFTGASGKNSYTTPAHELPLQHFSDQRTAIGLDYVTRTSPTAGRTLTADVSKESDYLSLGASATWTTDFNNKLTTLALGLGGSYDLVQPKGFPTGLTSTSAVTTTCASGGGGGVGEEEEEHDDDGCDGEESRKKVSLSLLTGLTQVLSRRTLMQLNYTLTRNDGYLTDPYKIISVVDPVTGAPVDYKYEKRPSDRLSHAVFVKLVHSFDQDVAHLSYRYFRDDWGIRAHTVDAQYRFRMGERFYLEPQYHRTQQTAADFFHHALTTPQRVEYASADLRLGAMVDTMVALKVGAALGSGELSLRYARMTETGEGHPSDAIGALKSVDLYPQLDVNIWNLGFVMPL